MSEPVEIVIDLCGGLLSQYSLEQALSKARASEAETVNITINRVYGRHVPQFVCVDNLLAAVIEQVQKGMTTNCPDCRKPRT